MGNNMYAAIPLVGKRRQPSDSDDEAISFVSKRRQRFFFLEQLERVLWLVFLAVFLIASFIFGLSTACFYGRGILKNKLEAWDLARPGVYHDYYNDSQGRFFRWNSNSSLSLHFLGASYLMIFGPLQYIPWIRRKHSNLHRWNGRLVLLSASFAAMGGMLYVLQVGVSFEPHRQANVMNLLFGATCLLCGFQIYRHAKWTQDIDRHKQWAYRFAGIFFGNIFVRLYLLFIDKLLGTENPNPTAVAWAGTLLQYIFFLPFFFAADLVWKREQDTLDNDSEKAENSAPSGFVVFISALSILWLTATAIMQSIEAWIPFMSVGLDQDNVTDHS